MLRITVSASAAQAQSYYTQGLSREDYYAQDQGRESIGRWHGRGAALLGLAGEVDQAGFVALTENRDPRTGALLTARLKEDRRPGYDFTFSAPKSVSLLEALTGDARIREAFTTAVHGTMREMEAGMKTRVRQHGEDTDRTTGNLVWCDFVHTTTRPVDGLPDPDLHMHCYALNVTYDPVEQRWKAGQFGDLKRDAPYYEAAFQARLAAGMKALGFEIERHGKWWDVAGVPRDLIEKFSRRSAAIEKEAAKRGITDPAAKSALGARTREAKALHLSAEALLAGWRSRLTSEDQGALAAVLAKAWDTADGVPDRRVTPEAALRHAVEACFERASVVGEKHVLEAALRRGAGDVLPEDLHRQAARTESGLLTATVDGRTLVTTRAILAEEQAMLAFARNGRGACVSLGGPAADDWRSVRLNPGQEKAVRHVLTSCDRVMMIRGGAGTGKTTLMREAVAQIEARSGKQVFAFAPTAEASRGVLRQEGFAGADTVARLLRDEVLQQRLKGNVLWIDEAGLLSVRDMGQVFALADGLDARVILSGDARQHGSVQRGDALRLLEDKAGVRPVELTDILRQRGEYKIAVETIAKGDLDEGFARLDRLGWVIELPDATRHARLAEDYLQAIHAGKTALVVAPTHQEGEAVTALIRQALKAEGRMEGGERTVRTLRNLYWTAAERGDAAHYRPGLVVQFFQNARGIKSGARLRITGRDAEGRVQAVGTDGREVLLPLSQPDRFQVYEPRALGLAVGETLRLTQNGKDLDGVRLNNGARYTVKDFTAAGDIVLDNGSVLGRDFGHLAHGYCTTSHASQGKTVDMVCIAQGSESFPASSREQFYVSVSRGREQARIYTDDKEALRARIQDSGQRGAAVELLAGEVSARGLPRYIEALVRTARGRYRRTMARRQHVQAARGQEQAPPLALVSGGREYGGMMERERHDGMGMER